MGTSQEISTIGPLALFLSMGPTDNPRSQYPYLPMACQASVDIRSTDGLLTVSQSPTKGTQAHRRHFVLAGALDAYIWQGATAIS